MRRICFFLFLLPIFNALAISNNIWTHKHHQGDERENVRELLNILKRSTTGRRLIKKARERAGESGRTLLDVIKAGHSSLTDTTLVRRFSPRRPASVVYEQKSVVYIAKDSRLYDAVLDLAHELTHFSYRENFNPYQRNFSLQEFMASTIEGIGGEVDAYMMECKVLTELFTTKVAKRYQCGEIYDAQTRTISRDLAIKKFYQVGNYYSRFTNVLKQQKLDKSFPKLRSEQSVFISSAYGMPYPIAAYFEYRTVLSKACDNDKKRISYFQNSERSPASERNSYSEMLEDYDRRCRDIPLAMNLF